MAVGAKCSLGSLQVSEVDGLDRGEPSSIPRRSLIKMAEGVLDEMEDNQDEVDVSQYLTGLLSFMS